MHYSTRIEDYQEAIAGCDAFFVAEREHFKIINYRSLGEDVFPDPESAPDAATARLWGLRRQCRGLVFSHDGDVISLPYSKFFNALEKPETQLDRIDLSQPHVILEKLDGSLVRPIPVGDSYIIGTKMGKTEVADQAAEWMRLRPNYHSFIQHCLRTDITPLWEWCSVQNRVVIFHPEDRMVMTAARNIRTGEYVGMAGLRAYCEAYDMELVRSYTGTEAGIQALIKETHALMGAEGWVIRFDTGNMIKIKSQDYVCKHNILTSLQFEKNVIEILLLDKADDVKSMLDGESRDKLSKFETQFWQGIGDTLGIWRERNLQLREAYPDRKQFAVEIAPHIDPYLRGAMFASWENPAFDWREAVIAIIAKNIGSQNRVDAVRYLFGGARWVWNSSTTD